MFASLLVYSLLATPAVATVTTESRPTFEEGQAWVAVLTSGRRVPCEKDVAAGARVVPTPFGTFDASIDPVKEIVDVSAEARMLDMMRQSDFTSWVDRSSKRGLIGPLLEAARKSGDEQSAEERHALLSHLEQWGRELDPVPAKVPYDKRVDWLWAKLKRADEATAALYTGRLLKEISGPNAPFDRRIGLVDLRKGQRDRNPAMRRAAALISAHQAEQDMRRNLAQSSLEDPNPEVRLASAHSTHSIHELQALGRWTIAMWRAKKEEQRVRAIEYLGEFGNAQTVDTLMYTLAAAQASASGNPGHSAFTFFGRQISLVRDFDVEVAQAAAIADPVVDVVTEGTVLHVRVISSSVVRTTMNALQRLTGANPGPGVADWISWYEARQGRKP